MIALTPRRLGAASLLMSALLPLPACGPSGAGSVGADNPTGPRIVLGADRDAPLPTPPKTRSRRPTVKSNVPIR
jgi:hypothetical protein